MPAYRLAAGEAACAGGKPGRTGDSGSGGRPAGGFRAGGDRLGRYIRPIRQSRLRCRGALNFLFALTSLDVQMAYRLATEAGHTLGQSDRVSLRIQVMLRSTASVCHPRVCAHSRTTCSS